jgi:serine/threonine protein kinase
MPINSLYVRKKKKDNIVIFSLVSFLHNLEQKKNYYCDKIEDVNRFYSKFNKSKMFRDIKKEYYFKIHIGEGQFGQVLLAERNSDNKKLAVKLVQKGTQSIEEYKVNRWEIDIFKLLQNIQHPNVVQCIDLYEYESQIFFVYEYIAGGDLRKICKELKLFPQYYTINTILKFSMQMIEGMRVLHKYGVIHRDIKTTNMVVDIIPSNKNNSNSGWEVDYSNINNSEVKVIDFGLSRILGKFENSNDPYGSLCFKAPELIKHEPYNFKVDVWAIGITIYYLVYKELPFEKGSKEEIKYGIVHENAFYPRSNFILSSSLNNYYDGNNKIKKLNNSAIKSNILYSMIKDCLEKNPEERLSIEQLSDKYTPLIQTIP